MDAADTLYGVSMGGDGVSRGDLAQAPRRTPAHRRSRGLSCAGRPRSLARTLFLSSAPMARTWRSSSSARTPDRPESPSAAGFFRRLRENMSKTREALGAELQATVFQTLDDETFERLEETLIYADVGAPTTATIVERLETRGRGAASSPAARTSPAGCTELLADDGPGRAATRSTSTEHPTVILVVGRQRQRQDDHDRQDRLAPPAGAGPLGAARRRPTPSARPPRSSSTLWAERAGCEIVRGEPGSDPGAVAFDAIEAARARGHDVVIVRHRRPPPHPAAPDGGAAQGAQA